MVYEADNLDISYAELKVNLEAAQGKTTWRKKPIVIAHDETFHLSTTCQFQIKEKAQLSSS